MPLFDDEEAKKIDDSLKAKYAELEKWKVNFTPEKREELMKHLDDLEQIGKQLKEKEKTEPLTEEEKKVKKKIYETALSALQSFQDAQLLLGAKLYGNAVIRMNHLKGLADKGDYKAKEMYDELYKLYRAGIKAGVENKESKN